MLSDSERRRLAELERLIGEKDPRFAATFNPQRAGRSRRARLLAAVAVAAFGSALAVVSLIHRGIAPTVVGICLVGAAGCMATWRRPNGAPADPGDEPGTSP